MEERFAVQEERMSAMLAMILRIAKRLESPAGGSTRLNEAANVQCHCERSEAISGR
jgi:hypothetical protein